jgi:GDP-L-fucose synthase
VTLRKVIRRCGLGRLPLGFLYKRGVTAEIYMGVHVLQTGDILMIDDGQAIYVAGHKGMVGAAILRRLVSDGHKNILTRTHAELDLMDSARVDAFFERERPGVVFLAAARVGGIMANMRHQSVFLYENLQIQNSVIGAAVKYNVKKFVFLSSSCTYPRLCGQPMKEEYLLTGPFEPTNEGYAIAKTAGMKLLQYYKAETGIRALVVVPCNLYGPNDNYDLEGGHVLASLVRRFVDAAGPAASKEPGWRPPLLWGTGSAYREFMHVDDMVDATFFAMNNLPDCDLVNIGTGKDISIKALAEMIASAAGYEGNIHWDPAKPDGMPRKCLDVSRLKNAGWEASISLEDGVKRMIAEYRGLKSEGLVK